MSEEDRTRKERRKGQRREEDEQKDSTAARAHLSREEACRRSRKGLGLMT